MAFGAIFPTEEGADQIVLFSLNQFCCATHRWVLLTFGCRDMNLDLQLEAIRGSRGKRP